jgi:hypothetical protein
MIASPEAPVTPPSPGPRGKYGETQVKDRGQAAPIRFLCLQIRTNPARRPIEVRYHALAAQTASVFM